jgi:Mg-chelatase subunit ChlD
VFLPRGDDVAVEANPTPLSATVSGHYLIAVLFAIVLHVLLLIALGLMVWGGNDAMYSSAGVRVQIGRPPEAQRSESRADTFSNAPQTTAWESPPADLQQVFNQVDVAAWQQVPLTSAASSDVLMQSNTAALLAQDADLAANLNEDFGALLERLKRDGLDLVITFDSTGSMTGEINQVKQQIQRIGRTLMEMIPQTRISICTYRDFGDDYVVKGLPLTRNLDQIQLYLNETSAGGGGDEPEAVADGLKWAIQENHFNPAARKVILLFGDAPPHDASLGDCLKMAAAFQQRQNGIISTVTCRNPRRLPAFVQIAEYGGGEAFLTQDEREIVAQLVILVFGSQHQQQALEAFKMLRP